MSIEYYVISIISMILFIEGKHVYVFRRIWIIGLKLLI